VQIYLLLSWETNPKMTPQQTSQLLMGPQQVMRPETLQAILLLLSSSSSLVSPLCRVFTIVHLKQTIFLRYTVLHLSVFTICATCNVISPMKYVLYFHINTFVLCISLISCSPSVLLRFSVSDFEMFPVTPIVTGITFAFTFHMHWISIMRSLYFKNFWVSSLITYCLHWGESDVSPYWHHNRCLLA